MWTTVFHEGVRGGCEGCFAVRLEKTISVPTCILYYNCNCCAPNVLHALGNGTAPEGAGRWGEKTGDRAANDLVRTAEWLEDHMVACHRVRLCNQHCTRPSPSAG